MLNELNKRNKKRGKYYTYPKLILLAYGSFYF